MKFQEVVREDRTQLFTLEFGWDAGLGVPSGKSYGMLEGYHNKAYHITDPKICWVSCRKNLSRFESENHAIH